MPASRVSWSSSLRLPSMRLRTASQACKTRSCVAVYLSYMSVDTRTPYESMGGDAGIRRLVDRFYDLMDSAPEAATIRALHAASLKASRDKLYLYLSYWTGGPQHYIEQ